MSKTDWLFIVGLVGGALLIVEIQLYILYKGLMRLMNILCGNRT